MQQKVCLKAFVSGNLGDDLFIHTICEQFPKVQFSLCGAQRYASCFGEIGNLTYVATDRFFPKYYAKLRKLPARLGNLAAGEQRFPELGYAERLARKSKVNVLVTGSYFMEWEREFRLTRYLLREKAYFQLHPFVLGCNFGPYKTEEYKQFYESLFAQAAYISFRDQYSYELFGGENMGYAPDILFGYHPEHCIQPPETGYVLISALRFFKDDAPGISPEEEQERAQLQQLYERKLTELCLKLTAKGKRVVLLGFCNAQGDHEVNARILQGVREQKGDISQITVVNYPDISADEAVGYLKYADHIVTTRYHGMILGAVLRKRMFVISYSEKIDHVIEEQLPWVPSIKRDEIAGLDVDGLVVNILEGEREPEEPSELIRAAGQHFEKLREAIG